MSTTSFTSLPTLKINTIDVLVPGGSTSIGSNQSSGGSILLGTTSGTTQVQGILVANTLNSKTPSASMTIASTSTNATLTVGSNMTSSGGITLGSSACNTTVNGTLKTNTIESISTATTMNIGTVSRTTPINIGTGGINGAPGVTQGINIGSGTNNAYSFMSIGSDTMNYNYIRGTNIEMNTNNSGNTNIGWRNTGAGTYGFTNFYGGITSIGATIKNAIVGIGGNVKFVLGNTTGETAQSTTFCRKSTNTMTALNCFSIGMPAYSSAVFEITVCGSNQGSGGYCNKSLFTITGGGAGGLVPTVTPFSTIVAGGTGVNYGSTTSGSTVTITVNNSGGTTQTFCATLTQFASDDIGNNGIGFSVTAL